MNKYLKAAKCFARMMLSVLLLVFICQGLMYLLCSRKEVVPEYSLDKVASQIPFNWQEVKMAENEFLVESKDTGMVFKIVVSTANPEVISDMYVWR